MANRESLLTTATAAPQPLTRPIQTQNVNSNEVANDTAHIEVLATGNKDEFMTRSALNRKGQGAFTRNEGGTVENTVINFLKDQVTKGLITEEIGLDTIDTLPPEQRTARALFAIKKADLSEATQKDIVTYQLFLNGFGNLPNDAVDKMYNQYTFPEIEQLRNISKQERISLLRSTVDSYVAGQGWSNWGHAIADTSAQELIPIYNVMSKMAITRTMLDSVGIAKGDQPKFLLGEARKLVRDALVAMPANQRQAAVEELIREVSKLQSDPHYGLAIRQFGILENFEAVFTEGVLTGEDSNDSWDRFFGNFESAAEGLFSVLALARVGGKGVKSLFRSGDAVTAARVARETGNRAFQTRIEREFTGDVAREFGLDPDDMATARLARPQEFVDDRTVHLPGVKETNERLDRLEGKIMEANAGRFTRVLNASDKSNTADKALEDLDLGDQAVVAPGMSTIEELDDGVQVRAVIAKHGESGWAGFDELLPDLLSLDPNLEALTLLRRGEDGKLVEVPLTPVDLARIATTKPEALSDADLIARSGQAESDLEFLILEREAARRAGSTRTSDEVLGDEYFLQYDHFRAYHPTDKVAFGDKALRNTAIPFPLLTPNAKFGDEIVGAFQENYLQQERVGRLFENMYAPFYQLSAKDKKAVAHVYEWSEDFGKEFGEAPSLYDTLAQFPDMTQKQQLGLLALRRGMDTQYEVFNRRLYLEWNGLGFKTATPVDPSAARYHGKPLKEAEVRTGGTVYDPVKQEQVQVTKEGLATIYNDGGTILELDVPIDVPGTNGAHKARRVLIDGNDYKVGNLSVNPLEYYPGYSYRFYEDPYYIVKRQKGVSVDGAIKAGDDIDETAIKTAGSQLEAERFLGRMGTRTVDASGNVMYVDKEGFEYVIQRSADLAQTDQVFRQRQALQREGRLFWDHRNRDRLADVNGNQSEIMDFVKALERGTRLGARVNQEEDIMRATKNAFVNEYRDLLDAGDFAKKPASAIIEDLRVQLRNAANTTEHRERIRGALEIAKYIRQMEGVDSAAVPWMRAQVLRLAVWTDRMLNGTGLKPGKLGYIEKKVATADPIRASRSAAFHAFMVFRPFRQALLQMAQPLFLAGIDPLYVVSGKGLSDSIALRAGYWRFVDSGADAGYSNKALAKMMGLSKTEYTRLLERFEESGALDVVDVHSFAGGTNRFRKTSLPKDTVTSKALYGVRATGNAVIGTFKKVGFDFGEGMNKVATFNVAWRRVMKEKGYKSLLDLTDDDWKRVNLDTENLSLAMTRPNNAGYQSGLLAVTTQFLAFTHKVALTMLFQNPALKNKDVLKMYLGSFTLFGANMFGARDLVREQLTGMGFQDILDQNLPGQPGTTVTDLLSAGLIQTVINKLMETPIDTENFTPVLNVKQFAEMTIEGIIANPAQGMLGPFGNRASAFLDGLEFSRQIATNTDMPPGDKFIFSADMMMKKVFPQYNDITMAHIGYKMGRLYHSTGESIDLQPTWEAMVARGLFGARTTQEMAFYRGQDIIRDSDAIVRDMIMENRRFLKQYIFLYRERKIDRDLFHDAARIVGMMARQAPDGRVEEVIQGSMLAKFDDDDPDKMPASLLAEAMMEQKLTAAQAKDQINQYITDPVERELMHGWIDDSYDERILSQEEGRKRMIEQNPNIRD